MARPTSSTTVQRPDLGQVAWAYMTSDARQEFIGLKSLPIFDTPEKTGDFPKISIEALLSVKDTTRASRAAYNQSDWEFETGTYNCQDNGWTELLDDEERRLYAYLFDAEIVNTERATHIIMMNHEIRSAALLFNTSNFSNTAVTTEWSTAASATPHKDVTVTGFNAMKAVGGIIPDTGICSDTVFRNLINTDEVKDALKYTNPIEMGGFEAQKQAIAMYFGLREILVGSSVKSTAKKGQSAVIADIWDDEYFMLAKVATTNDLKMPQVGRTFLWTADSPGMLTTESYRVEDKRSNAYRVRHNVDEAIIFASAGYLLTNITA
jgi:hypothetical protein